MTQGKGKRKQYKASPFPFPCCCSLSLLLPCHPSAVGQKFKVPSINHKSQIAHYFTESTSYCSITLFQNLSTTSMRKYSKSAKRMKAMLIRIHWTRGQILPEGGILSVALLFRLIVIRSRVRSRPSLWKYEREQYHLDQQQQPIIMSCSSFSTSIITNR